MTLQLTCSYVVMSQAIIQGSRKLISKSKRGEGHGNGRVPAVTFLRENLTKFQNEKLPSLAFSILCAIELAEYDLALCSPSLAI